VIDRKQTIALVNELVTHIPCRKLEDVRRFIASKPEGKLVLPKPEIRIGEHWFCTRRYHDAVSGENILEVYIGRDDYGDEYMGYDRIDPRWRDAEGRDMERWELTRAYMRPKYRGQNYSLFMAELVLALCRRNRAYSVVAYPRHVAMLVTLLNYGFKTMDGNYDGTLHRILRDGRRWYQTNTNQRRLYYAQEFRPFIQDGSFIMEKRGQKAGLWDFLMEKV
jgi:GNAT superfamily N-acetyltransferase